jgi:hypothetical protein
VKKLTLAIAALALSGCLNDTPENIQSCCGEGRVPVSESSSSQILTHDFGLVEKQQKLLHTFQLRNLTGRRVTFLRDPDIGRSDDVELEVTSDFIAPGTSVEINVYYKTRERPGPFDVFVRLYPSDKSIPDLLHLGGVVKD